LERIVEGESEFRLPPAKLTKAKGAILGYHAVMTVVVICANAISPIGISDPLCKVERKNGGCDDVFRKFEKKAPKSEACAQSCCDKLFDCDYDNDKLFT